MQIQKEPKKWRQPLLIPDLFPGRNKMSTLWQDIRYGIRMLRRSPGFTAVAVLTLALGIGSSTAIFSVVNAVLLRPLPVEDSHELVWLRTMDSRSTWTTLLRSQFFVHLQDQAESYTEMAALKGITYHASAGEFPELIRGYQVSANLFSLICAEPFLGRTFLPGEGRAGQEQVVILGYRLWQRRFGGDPNLVGKSITVNDAPHTVVGIMSPEFKFFSFAKQTSYGRPACRRPPRMACT